MENSRKRMITEQGWGHLKVTKDEVSVARSTDLKDKYKTSTSDLIMMLPTHK